MEEAWKRAVQLSLQYDKDRVIEVVHIVGRRLNDIQKFGVAGQIYE